MNGNEIMVFCRRGFPSLLAVVILSVHMPASADEPAAVDTSRWTCKFCPFEEGLSGSLELGPGYVSEDSYKFGEYTGLEQQGGFVVGDASARYRDKDGTWLDFSGTDLGLESRSLSVEGGRQGGYRLSLSYRELPHFITDSAVSPFNGTGGNVLTLPSGWVPAGTTGAMTGLADSLHGVNLDTRRERLDLGAAFMPVTHWEFALRYRHETKTGALGTAGAFEFNAAELVIPVDYVTEQMDASAAYSSEKFHATFAYYGSTFTNNDDSLTWSNPYLPLVPGATTGELAQPPTNQFHQFVVSGGYEFTDRTVATAEIALGRMTQDETFLPATLNPNLTTPLPRASLDGSVDTTTANLKVTSAVSDRLRLNGAYTYSDRNNTTPQSTYDWVTTDTAPALPRTNQTYDFTRNVLKLDARYTATAKIRLGAGYDYDTYDRSLQEVDRTQEDTIWGRIDARVNEYLELTLRGAHADLNVGNYQAVAGIVPPENPLMRKYNMADRTRDLAELRADVMPTEWLAIGLAASLAKDNYSESVIGLRDDRASTLSADGSFVLGEKTTATVYLNHEQIESNQANAELSTVAATWTGRNNDHIDTAGLGIKQKAGDKLDIGADYTLSHSTGAVSVSGGTPGFPDLVSRLNSLKLYGTYQLNDKLALHLTYWYESYSSDNWMVDGVAPDTIPNVIAFGQGSPSYHVNVITVSGRYQF